MAGDFLFYHLQYIHISPQGDALRYQVGPLQGPRTHTII